MAHVADHATDHHSAGTPDAYAMTVTRSEFRRVARGLKDAFAARGIRIAEGPLHEGIVALESLASVPGRIWTRYESEPAERPSITRGVLALVRGHVLLQALKRVAGVPGLESVLRRLRGLRLTVPSEQTEAGDIHFELETCAQLLEAGARAEFGEPDIVLVLDDGTRLSVACKRPRALSSARRAVRDGTSQLVRSGRHGIVVLSLEHCVPQRVRGASAEASRIALREELERAWRRVIKPEPMSWRDPADGPEHHGTCLGVVVCATALATHPAGDGSGLKLSVLWEAWPHANSAAPSARRRVGRNMLGWLVQELRNGHARISRPAPG